MAAKKKRAKKTAKKTARAHFDWHPDSYAQAKENVDLARAGTPGLGATLATMMPGAIRTMGALNGLGGLTCPAPPTDARGTYRVGLDGAGRPEIQRQVGNDWVQVP